jgi:apolipoprotein N-acyltransferase
MRSEAVTHDAPPMREPSRLTARFGGPWGWLVLAVLLQFIANGRWIVPQATWLAPIGWLVYLERSRTLRALALALVLFVLVDFVAWRPIIPAPGVLYYLIAGSYAVVYFLPFAVHRVLAARLAGFKATLVFPTAWVAIEFVFHRWITPYGSWFSLAYTQTDFLPLLQIAAITGVAGISFLITWFAAVVAWSLNRKRSNTQRLRAAWICGLALLFVLAFGQLRLGGQQSDGELVRVAGVVPSTELMAELEAVLAPVRRGEPVTETELATITSIAGRVNEDLFLRTLREARAGARLVAWSETAGRVLKGDEPELLERAGRLAALEGIDLVLAYGVWVPDGRPPFENMVAAVSAAGDVAWEYQKAHPIVGAESSFTKAGDRIVRRLETEYGAVGAVICHDLDFAPLLRQASRKRIGLIVGPSADWPAITPLHANMAILRSIESGFSLLRPTSSGRSIATDTRGRTLAAVDYADDAMVAYVRAMPVRTVYGAIGDLFAWLCLGTLIGLAGLGAWRQRSRPGVRHDVQGPS